MELNHYIMYSSNRFVNINHKKRYFFSFLGRREEKTAAFLLAQMPERWYFVIERKKDIYYGGNTDG